MATFNEINLKHTGYIGIMYMRLNLSAYYEDAWHNIYWGIYGSQTQFILAEAKEIEKIRVNYYWEDTITGQTFNYYLLYEVYLTLNNTGKTLALSHQDLGNSWSYEEQAYDDNMATAAWINIPSGTWSSVLEFDFVAPTVTTQAATQIAYECAMGNGTITSGTNATERGFEVKTSFSGTLNDYIHHSIADFDGTASYNMATGNWEGTLTKTESETGDFAEGAYELVLGYPSVLGNPSHIFNDKLFKCESYTYRARATIEAIEYYGDWVAFSTLCDEGGDQEVEDDISDGDPIVPIIPIEPEPEPELPELPEEEEELPEFPPWEFPEMPPWEYPDYPPSSWVGDFYYRKPYTQKDLDELRKKCIIYNKNSIEFALVLRHNMNVLKEFFNMMTDYMDKEEFNDFTDLIPPQRLKELYLDPLEPVDFRDMINGFISNTIDNNIAVNRNFKLIQEGLDDYETESDDAYFREITSSMKPLRQDDPDVERMKRLIDSLNKEVILNYGSIMHNLKIIRARLL